MKITKLMLSAFVAAAVLVSCNKENHLPEAGTGVKTVNMSIGNLIMTKGLAGTQIASGTPVVVNDFQVFLTEASETHLYNNGVMTLNDAGSAYEAATFYWSGNELKNATEFNYDYHFVSPHCTKILVVANAGRALTLAEAKALGANIEQQQNPNSLLLFGEATLERKLDNNNQVIHEGEYNGESFYSEVYHAEPILYPTIARFEVDGFAMNFNGDALTEVKVTDILFQNFVTTMTASDPGTASHIFINDLDSDADVYYWFTSNTDDDTDATWYRDSFTDLTLTKPAAATEGTNYVDRAAIATPRAYHFFAPADVPDMVIKMMTTSVDASNNPLVSDAYVYATSFLDPDGNPLASIKPGVIYRMSGRAEAGDNKGFIDIDEDDLNTVDRCLDITVDVHKWEVVLVTPEF